jgi:hypothetical protein
MKKLFLTISIALVAISAMSIFKEDALSKYFTLADAGKILGEAAHLADSATKKQGNAVSYSCSFKANAPAGDKTGAIYYLLEKYDDVLKAHQKYSSIKKANENHEGIKTLTNLGDEAYYHSDGTNFYFIMARKGEWVLTMKVNKVTGNTSLTEFNKVAASIVEELL